MKFLRVFLVGVPVATYSLYSSNNTNNNNQICSLLASVNAHEKCLELEHVQVLFRHGARTPIHSRKKLDNLLNVDGMVWDKKMFAKVLPHVDINYKVKSLSGDETLEPLHSDNLLTGGCICGNLTTIGQQEAYEFGKWLHNEYITKHALLSPSYTSNDVYVRSTIKSRAVFTAVGVMAGLYGKENLSDPVLIHSSDLHTDNIFPNFMHCSKLFKRFKYNWKIVKDKQLDVNKGVGIMDGEKLYNFIEIHDIMEQRSHHGLFVPRYLLDNRKEIIENALTLLLEILGRGNVNELKNSIGSFVETVCCRINEVIDGTNEQKMILYSSHDTTVMCFLLVLGIFDNCWPGFVANVIIELYKDENDERFIRILYNNEVVVLDKESGEEMLSVDKFMRLVEKYRVVDWAEDCGNNEVD